MRRVPSTVIPSHPDYEILAKIRDAILSRAGGDIQLREKFPVLIRSAIEFVIDPVRTGRTQVADLVNVEKTFIGLKIEHFVRDMLDVPPGIRDLHIDGMDVDVKNTVKDTWMIPPETFRDESPVLVIASDDATQRCWLGLLKTRQQYLAQPNRDQKRAVLSRALQHVMWLVEAEPLPKNHWVGLDMARFRELRKMSGGTKRACQFFKENLRVPIHRSVVEALLFDQKDYMKRLRENGGARDALKKEGIVLLSGSYDSKVISSLELTDTARDEFIAAKPSNTREKALLRSKGLIAQRS